MSEEDYIKISEDYIGQKGRIAGDLRYDGENFYLNTDDLTSARVCGLQESDIEDKIGDEGLKDGVKVELRGRLDTTEPYGKEYFLEADSESLKQEKRGLKKERIEKLAEYLVPFVGQYEDVVNPDGVPLRVLRRDFSKVSSRKIRQSIINRLESEGENKLYRTRVRTERGREAGVTTREPPEKITEELREAGEIDLKGKWNRVYRSKREEEITAPETKYSYRVFSCLPELFMRHAKRHDEELKTWVKDKLSDEERGTFAWSLEGVDPESQPGEREIEYSIEVSDGKARLDMEIILRKRINCVWPVDPMEADKYMEAVLGSGENQKRGKLIERAQKGEELAEYAADLILDEEEEFDFDNWKRNFEEYRGFLISKETPMDYYERPKDRRKVSIGSDPFLAELDRYVDSMKGGPEEDETVSETKKELKKDTETAKTNCIGAVDEFLDYVKGATFGRISSGLKE